MKSLCSLKYSIFQKINTKIQTEIAKETMEYVNILQSSKKSNSNGNFIIKRSLTIGGILSLFYTIINYWEYLDDYSKLIMISFSIGCIIYYVY